MDPVQLLPVPRQIERGGAGAAVDAPAQAIRDPALPAQGYALSVSRDGIHIRHADAPGLRYARETLAQLRSQADSSLPGLRIRDWPDFIVRGYMLDVSRDRVPTRATLEGLVDLLALVRINQLQLYTEHSFAYRDHETVWRDASPITPEDLRWLDALCGDRGVELVANQNCFGHMGRWLRHPDYRHRAEAPDGWESRWGGHQSASVLAPTDDNAEFALGLVRELMGHFRSRRVNIGCDETFELGLGRSREAVAARGRGRVYLEHLQRLLAGLHAEGCEVQFWGDIVRQHPELVSELPKDGTVALVWHYEAPMDAAAIAGIPARVRASLAEFGFTPDSLGGFAGQVSVFAEANFPFWVCPGTSTWNALIGRLDNARANLRDAARVGRESGAGGFLITDWGDNGHLQPPAVSVPPLVYGAALEMGYTAADTLFDAPVVFVGADNTLTYSPRNFYREYHGISTLRQALEKSYNVTAVKLQDLVTAERVIDFAHRCGIRADLRPYASLALGVTEVSPLELAIQVGGVARLHLERLPWLQVADFQEMEEIGILIGHARDHHRGVERTGQQVVVLMWRNRPFRSWNRITVRIDRRVAQHLVNSFDEPVGRRMLESLGFVVHVCPPHAQDLYEE